MNIVVNRWTWKEHIDFFPEIAYTTNDDEEGSQVNEFEQNVQSKRNDAVDSAVGFIVSFGFFATLFIIATAIKLIGS